MLELSVSWCIACESLYLESEYPSSVKKKKNYIVEQQPKNLNSFKSFNRVN